MGGRGERRKVGYGCRWLMLNIAAVWLSFGSHLGFFNILDPTQYFGEMWKVEGGMWRMGGWRLEEEGGMWRI